MYTSFEEMPVWQKAMELAVRIFQITEDLPRKEDYGLTSQIRRSGLSVSANIAEAFGRKHTLDKLNFYYHARGSISETRSHLIYGNRNLPKGRRPEAEGAGEREKNRLRLRLSPKSNRHGW